MKTVTVLLVGGGARHAPTLRDHLERRGCIVSSATSCAEAISLLKTRHFDLVLSEFLLSGGTAYQLVPVLQGTDTTMFFSNAVEDGCWWMNAVLEGQDHTAEPGMRPAEFRVRLDEILFDKRFGGPSGGSAVQSGSGPTGPGFPEQIHSLSSAVRGSPEVEQREKP
jgi:hypothetical protein